MSFTLDPTPKGYRWSVTEHGHTLKGHSPNETAAMRSIAKAKADLALVEQDVTEALTVKKRDRRRSED